MNRRQIIKYTSVATGAVVGAPLLSALLSGCKPEAINIDQGLKIFSSDDFKVLKLLIDLILPKTDSPSASDVGVHHTIDHMIANTFKKEDQTAYFKRFQKLAIHLSTMDFFNLEKENQSAILKQVMAYDHQGLKDVKDALTDVRQQAIAFYLSSEKISTSFLNYLPVPENWEPCISVEEVGGKSWAI